MEEDPLGDLIYELSAQQPQQEAADDYRLPASVLEIPESDRGLFEQLRANPKISDISDEIAFNKYLRILLQREFEKWAYENKRELIEAVLKDVDKYVDGKINRSKLKECLGNSLPAQNLTVNQARMLSKLLETSGKLAEQHKKITEGMTIKVDIADPGVVTRMLVQLVYPCVPRDAWEAIRVRARSFAPSSGSSATLELE